MEFFSSWVAACWPDKLDLVAIDGKTSRAAPTIAGPATRRSVWAGRSATLHGCIGTAVKSPIGEHPQ
jgi:hypothetical protein